VKLVVDTNIIFSGLLSPVGTISDLLINSSNKFELFFPTTILEELDNHEAKILKISGYTKREMMYQRRILLKGIDLIDLESIKTSTLIKALELTKDVDEFDAPFIALALDLECSVWTGDKKLINGLKNRGVDWILSTDEIIKIRDEV